MTDAAQSSDRSLAIALAYEAEERRRKLYSFVMVLLAVAVLVAGLRAVEDANAGSFIDGLSQFFDYPIDILSGALAAGWNWFPLLLKYFPYLVETINMALVSTFFGFLGAFVITFVGSRNLVPYGPVVWVARRIMDVSRAFPEIVIALFLLFIFSPTPLAAVIAIAFHTIGALGKLFSEVVENADMKPVEGLAASGGSWLQRVWFGVVPQVMPNFLSYTLLR
ncbi:MAG: ABC transporter permease subunit, partial [Pseudomonadota bacterium]